jgi:DNA-binding NtrC family response regulator
MSMPMQQKLLKAIEEKSFYAVGGSKPIRSDFILITATCEDIQKKIKTGDFREDLFFRLAGLTLEIPSLRERPEDILVYTNIFKKQLARHVIISKAAQEQMQRHSWPGNLRELKQAIQSFSDRSQGIVELFQPSQSVSAHQSEEIISQEIRNYILTHGLRSYIQLVEKTMVQDLLQKHSGKITSCMKELKVSSSAMYRILQENQLKI